MALIEVGRIKHADRLEASGSAFFCWSSIELTCQRQVDGSGFGKSLPTALIAAA